MSIVHSVRRGAWRVQDALYGVGLVPYLFCTYCIRDGGRGMAGAFAFTILAGAVTAPLWGPVVAVGWIIGKVFHTGPICREIQAEYNEKLLREKETKACPAAIVQSTSVTW